MLCSEVADRHMRAIESDLIKIINNEKNGEQNAGKKHG
jgi:hypothetical protein